MGMVKPPRWNVNQALLAPDYRKLWYGLIFATPIWEPVVAPRDLITGTVGIPNTGPNLVSTVAGQAIHFDHTATPEERVDMGDLPEYEAPTTAITVAATVIYSADGDRTGFWIGKGNHPATPFHSYAMINSRNTGVRDATLAIGTEEGLERATHAGDLDLNRVYNLAGRWTSGGPVEIFVDGVFASDTLDLGGTILYGSSDDNLYLGHNTLDDRTVAGDLILSYVWDRALSDGEIALLNRDAYGLFRMDPDLAALYASLAVCVPGTNKRRSSMFPVPGLVTLPCPDGTIDALDRRQVAWIFPLGGAVEKTIITNLAALLQKQNQLITTDLDAALQTPGIERTVSLAALIQLANITISTDLDAKLKAVAILRTTDLDAALQSPNLLRTVLLDAILAATVQLTVSTDAILKAIGVTRTTDLDAALVLLGQLKTLSMDAAIQLANLTVTTDLDAKLRALAITSITDLDSVLKATGVTETVLLDAILKAIGVTRTTDLDAALVLLNITSITDLDAILKIVGALETTDLDAALQVVALTRTTDLDAILKALGVTATTDLDAIVKIVGALATTDLDAAIQALGQTETADLDAVITGAAPVTIITDLDAKLRALGLLKSANLDAAIQLAGVTRITDLDAALLSSETIETALDALLFAAGVTVTTALDARITGIATRLIATSLDAHLGFPTTELGIKPSWLGSVGQRMWVKYYAPFRTLDTFPPLGTPNVTLSARVDAILQEPGATLASSLDAMIALVAVQQSVNLDSVLSDDPGMRTENVSLDAALGLVALTLGVSLDGSVASVGQLETAVLDASLTLVPLLTTDLDSKVLLEDLTLSASLDASLQSGTTPAAPSNLVATEI